MTSVALRVTARLALAVALASSVGASAEGRPAQVNNPAGPYGVDTAKQIYAGDVYLLRGFGDVFSRGLDDLATKLADRGVEVRVIGHAGWEAAASTIIANQERYGRRPVVLIGHSLGANAAILIAERLRAQNIEVQYLVTFAATAPDPVPGNVEKVANYYFATHGWGEKIVGGAGFHGILETRTFRKQRTLAISTSRNRPISIWT
ncbi:thioesterase domain-containing protein [Rhizobiaceae sp. 2RAB30]